MVKKHWFIAMLTFSLIAVNSQSQAFAVEIRNSTGLTVAFSSGGVVDVAPSTHAADYYYLAQHWTFVPPGGTFRAANPGVAAVLISGNKLSQIVPPANNPAGQVVGVDPTKRDFFCRIEVTGETRNELKRLEAFRRAGCPARVIMYDVESYKSPLFDNYEISRSAAHQAIDGLKGQTQFGGTRFFVRNSSGREATFQVRFMNTRSKIFTIQNSQKIRPGDTKRFDSHPNRGQIQIDNGTAMVAVQGRDFSGNERTWGWKNGSLTGMRGWNPSTGFEQGKRWYNDIVLSLP